MSDNEQKAGNRQTQETLIATWLQKVRFRKQIFGGVRESDVWTKIGELNELYKQALMAERARYDALLADHDEKKAGDES